MRYFDRSVEMTSGFETDYVRIIYYDIPHTYNENYRSYEYHRVCSIIEGRRQVTINSGKTFEYDREDFIILPPESTVKMRITVPTRALVLEFSDRLIEHTRNYVESELEIPEDLLNFDSVYRQPTDCISHEFDQITQLAMGKTVGKELLVDLHAQKMAYTLLSQAGAQNILLRQNSNQIVRAINMMHSHCDEGISLVDIAHSLGLSSALFSMKFKKVTGFCPSQYFARIKMAKSKELLKHMSVTDTAYSLGYNNISHFITLFKKNYGRTPKQHQLKTARPDIAS